jgi:type IV fimbrial biogenesis protein FimT
MQAHAGPPPGNEFRLSDGMGRSSREDCAARSSLYLSKLLKGRVGVRSENKRSAFTASRRDLRIAIPPRTLGGQAGFTIIELLIVVTIVAIIAAVAAPSLRTMIITNQVRTVTSGLLNDIALSRSESSKRSQRVVMCASTDMSTCSGSAWGGGWISFVDANNDQQRDTATTNEPLIRVKEAAPVSVKIITEPAGLSMIGFRSFGIIDAAKTFTICPVTPGTGIPGRSITMNTMGRMQTVNATTAVCEA